MHEMHRDCYVGSTFVGTYSVIAAPTPAATASHWSRLSTTVKTPSLPKCASHSMLISKPSSKHSPTANASSSACTSHSPDAVVDDGAPIKNEIPLHESRERNGGGGRMMAVLPCQRNI